MNLPRLIVQKKELPLTLELQGDNGECEFYVLQPANRKFGVCLNKIWGPMRQILLSKNKANGTQKTPY